MVGCCGHCVFWSESDGEIGQCKRHAPLPISHIWTEEEIAKFDSRYIVDAFWPDTSCDNWCGEFVPLEGQELKWIK